jgi:16S rRNA (guanine966-N2)-methyltransferase
LRIIAGESRGRRLKAPRATTTRPVTARVRQSIFSRLAARAAIAGSRVLDLYAGSGSLGIEALSRGAAHATFVDSAPAAAAAIAGNLSELKLAARATVMTMEVGHALLKLKAAGERFDLVFIDAPYRDDRTSDVLQALVDLNLLAGQAWVVARQYHRAPEPAGAFAEHLERASVARLGDHRIALYRRSERPPG